MKILLSTFITTLAFTASVTATAADVSAIWGEPASLEFVENTVDSHTPISLNDAESYYTTEFAKTLVRFGAKSIASFGVLDSNNSATGEDFMMGLDMAADVSRVVATMVGPLRGAAICDVVRARVDTTVFVHSAMRGDTLCGTNNVLTVWRNATSVATVESIMSANIPTARIAADLSNFATLNPHLSGARLLHAYQFERR